MDDVTNASISYKVGTNNNKTDNKHAYAGTTE
jgi:hypothetical protein